MTNEAVKLIRRDIAKIRNSTPEPGTVIRFDMIIEYEPTKGYSYAAIYVNNFWYLSGRLDSQRDINRITHDRLTKMFANEPDKFQNIRVATAWEDV